MGNGELTQNRYDYDIVVTVCKSCSRGQGGQVPGDISRDRK